VAEEHFNHLRAWLGELGVPPARQRQLLHAARFNWFQRVRHQLWMLRNRWSYRRRYRNYATPRGR
jgi:hypothetical protein